MLVCLLGVLLGPAPAGAQADAPAAGNRSDAPAAGTELTAEWQAHQLRFWYAGFTTYYTCNAIEQKVRRLLLAFGARDDAEVHAPCMGRFNEVQPMYNMTLGFAVPVPAEPGISTDTFPASWEEVQIRDRRPRTIERGDCELVEQFMDQVAPLFGPVNLEQRTRCIPNRVNLGSPNVKALVIKAKEMPEEKIIGR